MNFTQIYLASPDWLKLVIIVTPQATIFGLVVILVALLKRPPPPPPPEPPREQILPPDPLSSP